MAAPLNFIEAQNDNWYASRAYKAVSVTIASPAVFTSDGHGLITNDTIKLFTTGALPTGLSADTFYYVIYVTDNTFKVSATRDGTAIDTSGAQSGTHYFASNNAQRIGVAYVNNR